MERIDMKQNEKYKAYCISLGEVLKEYTNEAIEKKKNSIGTENANFDAGYLNGFYRIITLMQQQAEVFELSLDELGIDIDENKLI